MKKILLLITLLLHVGLIFAINYDPIDEDKDTIRVYNLDEFVITSSVKETNVLKRMPTAVSIVSPKMLQERQVESLPSLSGLVPNFFVPNYGSKVSTPIYIRGVGARLGSQTVSLYVDNVPYFNPSAFDFEFQDIQRIEVLRGAQGTLYGRNAIGGIVNVYTLSPLTYQGSSVSLGGGNYGQMEAHMSNYSKFNDKFGTSLALYYKRNDGYFRNNYTGKRVDDAESMGGRLKFELAPTDALTATLFTVFDYVSQGAFPYMHVDSAYVDFNEPASYKRNLVSQGLSLKYQGDGYVINSNTGYQFLNDHMKMDQDYSRRSVFSIEQEQNEHSVSQEFTFKSDKKERYQWVVGAFGFYDFRKVTTPVAIKKDGMGMLQDQLDNIFSNIPPGTALPSIQYASERIDIPGIYRKPSKGIALFQQSSINNLFGTKGLSLTFGIRADYEHTAIDYYTETEGVKVNLRPANYPPSRPPIVVESDTLMQGRFSKDFWQVLPKLAVQYDIKEDAFVYLSASKGYKTGGYNEQSFSKISQDIMRESLMKKLMGGMPGQPPREGGATPPAATDKPAALSLEQQLSFDPETSWNYELGGRFTFLNNKLNTTFSIFAIDVKNIQLIHLTEGGRTVSNGGKSSSKGAELSLAYSPSRSFSFFTEYGFVNAEFKNYLTIDKKGESVDYSGNKIPFAPGHTLSVGGSFRHSFNGNSFIDHLSASIQYTGAGKIYWTESNNAHQSFYGLTNATVSVEKGSFGLEVWGKNIFDTSYDAFYFEASDISGPIGPFAQRGYPAKFGATVKYTVNY